MGEYQIQGGKKLCGRLKVTGGKNAALPILAATLLNGGENVIHNCPRISDIFTSLEILKRIGCKVTWEGSTVIVDSSTADTRMVPDKLGKDTRGSIFFLGALLGRFGRAKVLHPGGCDLGQRPIDLHLYGLECLGAKTETDQGYVIAESSGLTGANIALGLPSVGATENCMLAAAMAEGETVISNAAREPEIVDLQGFLNSMGADVRGAGSDMIRIKSGKPTRAEYSIMPDRIVAGTYLTAAAITGGSILLTDTVPGHLTAVIAKLRETGCVVKEDGGKIYLEGPPRPSAVSRIRTHPHPGFPTDMQPPIMALLATARGVSIIDENLFDRRFNHVCDLNSLGANISLSSEGKTAFVEGVPRLTGAKVHALDLRGGAALILAGLAAEGQTVVGNAHHVERGYENIADALKSVGADIRFIDY